MAMRVSLVQRLSLLLILTLLYVVVERTASGEEAGCLMKGRERKDLVPVTVRFEGGLVAENIVAFYEYLWENSILPCITMEIPNENVRLADLLVEERILPPGYPESMSDLLCKINPNKCPKEKEDPYHEGDIFTVPGLIFRAHTFIDEVPVNSDEKVPADVEKILTRQNLLTKKTSEEERQRLLKSVSKRNLGFVRPFYWNAEDDIRIRIIYVPRKGYAARVDLPLSDLGKHPTLIKLMRGGNFFVEKTKFMGMVKPQSLTREEVCEKSQKARDIITMPDTLCASREQPKIIIADQGFDENNVFFGRGDRDQQSREIVEALEREDACNPPKKNHGTHIWGIICARIPGLMEGIAHDADVRYWDFDNPDLYYGRRFTVYLQSEDTVDVNIVNLSVHLSELVDSNVFKKVVKNTRNFLYVVAAGNEQKKFEESFLTPLPVSEHSEENVIVVAALDETGKSLWRMSNRNARSESRVVHVASPGVDILSTCRNNSIGMMTGTSQAAAFVSGAAALLVREGEVDPWRLKFRLLYTADLLPDLGESVMAGRLNVARALDINDDKLCLLKDLPKDCKGCGQWQKGKVKFGVWDDESGKLQEIKKVFIRTDDGKREQVRTNALLRIFGSPKKLYTVFYLEKQKLKRLTKVDEIRPTEREHQGKQLLFWSDRWKDIPHLTLSQVGDFVRNINFRIRNY